MNADSASARVDLAGILGRRPRVAIGHPHLGRGGSESRVMWLIEGLKVDCDLTVVTTGGWDLVELNRAYDTKVRDGDIFVRLAPFPRLLHSSSAAALRAGYYQRYCRMIATEFDLCISAYNCTDWGVPAIQWVADFVWDTGEVTGRNVRRDSRFIYRDSPLRRAYLSLSKAIARPSGRNMFRDDTVVANSCWTARQLAQFGVSRAPHVIPPPVSTTFPEVPWERRDNAFVFMGRIVAEKRVDEIIGIVAILRERGYPLYLYIAGRIGNDPYGRRIEKLCRQHSEWLRPVGYVSDEAKKRLLTSCRYAINAHPVEAFGISIVESMRAGCLPFAPADGGQGEILAHPALLFRDATEALDKITAVLGSEPLQMELRIHLKRQAGRFSHEATVMAWRELIAQVLTMTRRERERVG